MQQNICETLISLLVCPISGEPLQLSEDKQFLVAEKAQHRYPIEQGIATLISEFAQ